MQPLDVFYVIVCFSFLYLITEILKELRCIRSELLHSVNTHEREMKKFHSFHNENLLEQIPTRAFIRDLIKDREDVESQIKAFTSEAREQRYKRLSEAFSPPNPNKDAKNV